MKIILLFPIMIFLLIHAQVSEVHSQAVPEMPANLMGNDDSDNSLANMLKMDLMKRFLDAQKNAPGQNNPQQEQTTGRRQRPKPELGQRPTQQDPVDLSQYLGPDGDPDKTLETLRDRGVIPPDQSIPAPPPDSATSEQALQKADLFSDVPLEKHIDYAKDLMDRRQFQQAEGEISRLLNRDLSEEQKIEILAMREKALFHNKHHQVVQDDFYRLKAYYPDAEAIDELKDYLEQQTGIAPLQQQLIENPNQPELQHQLLQQYQQYNWLDFAEEFFAREMNDTSPATIRSLSEIYYRKQDYDMMIMLAEKAHELHPTMADFPYNEGVAYYMKGDPLSRDKSLAAFQQARDLNPSPVLRQNLHWYLSRLLNLN